jgi:hypothetical protein
VTERGADDAKRLGGRTRERFADLNAGGWELVRSNDTPRGPGLTCATPIVRDVRDTGVGVIDPWAGERSS